MHVFQTIKPSSSNAIHHRRDLFLLKIMVKDRAMLILLKAFFSSLVEQRDFAEINREFNDIINIELKRFMHDC